MENMENMLIINRACLVFCGGELIGDKFIEYTFIKNNFCGIVVKLKDNSLII